MNESPFSLDKSTLAGQVDDLMRPSNAREFIQPWYIPISTLPENTGMAVGGIGSSFTVTPAGGTPALHFAPGLHVTGAVPDAIKLQNFFFCERPFPGEPEPTLADFAALMRRNHHFTLRRGLEDDASPWLEAGIGQEDAIRRLEEMRNHPRLYADNRERLERWHIALSRRTLEACADLEASGKGNIRLANAYLLLDFFSAALRLPHHIRASLIGSSSAKGASKIADDAEDAGVSGYPSQSMEYQALYPLARTTYSAPGQTLRLTRLQFSLAVPGDERLLALPVVLCRFTLENPGTESIEATLLQTQENLCGYNVLKKRPGVQDAEFLLQKTASHQVNSRTSFKSTEGISVQGVAMRQTSGRESGDLQGVLSLLAGCDDDSAWEISVKPAYYGSHEENVVKEALDTGRLGPEFDKGVYSGRELLSGAICATTIIPPGATREITFALSLDFPRIELPGVSSRKRYEIFFPDTPDRATEMAVEALSTADSALDMLRRFHERTAAQSEALFEKGDSVKVGPGAQVARFVTQLCNTLSFLPEATVWDTQQRFWVRECADYPFFNSLDVYFYGSFSMLRMLPSADAGVMREFAKAVLQADPTQRRHWEYVGLPHADLPEAKLEGPRAARGAVPHDLGSPFDAKPDAYDWHNVKTWKDLAPKFVLLVLRSHKVSGDDSVLRDCWEAVRQSIGYLAGMREPGQAFPLTQGTDDTFDNLSSHGISIYSGSLWVAGLKAAAEIARLLGQDSQRREYAEMASGAEAELSAALWDESEGYYHFYVTPVTYSDIEPNEAEALRASLIKAGVSVGQEELSLGLNAFLNADAVLEEKSSLWISAKEWAGVHLPQALTCFPENRQPTRREARAQKKIGLYVLHPAAFTESYSAKLLLDSDDSFCDQFLADTYLQLLDLEPITPLDRRRRALQRIVKMNWKTHSPDAGAANLSGPQGETLEPFQARDAWIGLQHSLAAALLAAGLKQPAEDLLENTYRNLYTEARIPFAAPEGFTLLEGKLHYTAGRYFRPGMIWALPMLLEKIRAGELREK